MVKTDLNPYGSPILNPVKPAQPGKSKALPGKLPSELKPIEKDYKVDLSASAKAPVPPAPTAPSLPDIPEAPKLEEKVAKEAIKEAVKVEEKVKAGTLKKPAIIFVSGAQFMFSPSQSEGSYAGVGRMAESVEGSRLYDWNQKEEIIEHIKKVHVDQPVILVGHSLGGDTVKEVADELDSLDHNFRKVDLLVTLDAVGFGNDIIPQNVKQHLNVFGENDFFLNDGPHVARRFEKTKVDNILSPLDHTELDDAKDVQFEIIQSINRTLGRA